MAKIEVRTDISKNRLYVVLDGFFTDEEVKKAVDKIVREVKKLKPGFTAINDISKFRPATPQGAAEIQRGQKLIHEAGLGRVIRIVESPLAQMQFRRTAKQVGYVAGTAASIQEAEAMLDRGE